MLHGLVEHHLCQWLSKNQAILSERIEDKLGNGKRNSIALTILGLADNLLAIAYY